jgi:DNA-binding transcriptional LysR family regulator
MTFRQLEGFLAVARERSFSRGARSIHLSQSTLSEHIHDLEHELGKPLFLRRGRQVSLTEAGRVFEPHASRVKAALEDARQAVADLDDLGGGSLLVGASTTPGIYVLPAIVAAFRRRYPRTHIELRTANSRIIEERIGANELDLGIVGGHGLMPHERCLAAGILDELMLVVPPRHPWARRRSIPSTWLARELLLVREPGSATRQVMERALQAAGVPLGSTLELDHTEGIKQAIMAGLGIAFVSVFAVRGEIETKRLGALRLRGLRIRRHFHVIHNDVRTLSASARAFMALLEVGVPATPARTSRHSRPRSRRRAG